MKIKNLEGKSFLIIISSVIFYIAILLVSDIQSITFNFKNFSYYDYSIIFSLVIINIFISGYRYHFFLKQINVSITFKQSFLIFLAGLSMLVTPATSGSLIKSHIIKKKLGISFSQTSPLVFFERWIEFVSILFIMSILLIWAFYVETIIVLLIGIPISIIAYLILKKGSGIVFVNKIASKIPPLKNMLITTSEFKDSITAISAPKTVIPMFLLTLVTKINTIFMIYLIFQSFGINLELFSSGQIFFTSQLIGILSFIPGGILITETSLIGLLTKHGVEFAIASVAVIVIRLVTLWLSTIIGFIALWKVTK